ncbi:MAG: ribonuclease Z [Deltaproteobacteria bacterium]|nr:ribonuclease Z [Deltaproteobacteria bacterium]
MRPALHPRLINKPFDDPGLFISFLYEKRAILFDLGDISSLSAKDILKITHVFVTHTHMDHFIGFDRLLRLCLGREKRLYIYGPKGFFLNVEGKLAGYSWNLVNQYKNGLDLIVTEVHAEYTISREYRCKDGFIPKKKAEKSIFNGILLKEPGLFVHAKILDHKIPCIGLALNEQFHVNIMKDRVLQLGLETGPWLRKFKQALYTSKDSNSEIEVNTEGKKISLKKLKKNIARITPGQKIVYITDVGFNKSNLGKIIELAGNADHLFIEAVFLENLQDIAKKKYHLTARQAGMIAGMANVKKLTLFHFSPRYQGEINLLYNEAKAAYQEFAVF